MKITKQTADEEVRIISKSQLITEIGEENFEIILDNLENMSRQTYSSDDVRYVIGD